MSDYNDMQKTGGKVINFTIVFLGIVFGIINTSWGAFGVLFSVMHKNYYEFSRYCMILTEGILIIISLLIMFKKLHYKWLLSIPIITGIITIIIGAKYVNVVMIRNDFDAAVIYSNLIIGGVLLIIVSYMLIEKLNYKNMIFISIMFVMISVIIQSIYLNDFIKTYYRNRRLFPDLIIEAMMPGIHFADQILLTGISIAAQILFIIAAFIITIKKQEYKYMIFIPVIYGLTCILIGIERMYSRIERPFGYHHERNDVLTLGVLIYAGILLVIFLFRMIDKLDDKMVLSIPVPFGILNIVYGVHRLIGDIRYSYFSSIFNELVIIAEGVILIIISYTLIKKYLSINPMDFSPADP